MKSGEKFRRYLAVAVLTISVLASLLQFHSHDCGGHVRLDCNGHEFVLGCAHHDNACADVCHGALPGNARHSHSNSDCPLHLQSPALFSDQRHHEAPIITFDFLVVLTSGTELTDDLFVTNEKVSNQKFPKPKLTFLGVMPLRGSPVCI